MTIRLDPQHLEALERLEAVLRSMVEGALVTFSGGVDSSLLLRVARDVLGPERVVAFTAVSASLPREDAVSAREFARSLGVRHLEADPGEVEDPVYRANEGDRCYACKRLLMARAWTLARQEGLGHVLEGTVVDELQGHRPGMRAVREQGVRQPFLEAGLSKADVRALARHLGIPHWSKPALACLGSRFPVGTAITGERLERVGRVESALKEMGLVQFRARYHLLEGVPALRIEVALEELPKVVEPGIRGRLVQTCKAEGFQWITLDLEGYRTGSVSRRLGPQAPE